jgi:undecaprenyl-diphosphatase
MPSLLLQLERWDERLLFAVVARRRPILDHTMRAITHLADWPVAVAIALSMVLGLVPELQGVGWRMAWTLTVAHGGVEVLKRAFTRERPSLPVGLDWLVTVPDRFSFPSGHASAGLALTLPLSLALPLVLGLPVLALGIAVGISRSYLGVHYPGDVLAGWTLSATVLGLGVLAGL